MPYTIRRRGEKWVIVKRGSGETVGGSHATRRNAIRQMAAIEMSERRKRT